MKYALLDQANIFFRARHIASSRSSAWEKVGTALQITLASVNHVARKFDIGHVVVCLDDRSWRKDIYSPYKANRAVANAAKTEAEKEEDQLFWEAYNALISFFTEKTNVSVIRVRQAEADDIIARFIHLHPDDEHVIISTDSDYLQLINNNVHQYNGVTKEFITLDGYFDDKGNAVIDKKTKKPKELGDPQFVLFEKCMRGDSTDNIFSAYPGVRKKSSKNTHGLVEAYADRDKQGFIWNCMMMHKWTDHNEVEHKVRDDYLRNRLLIDLTAQPDDIKQAVDTGIKESIKTTPVSMVGIYFMRFCAEYELIKLSEKVTTYASWLNAAYKGELLNNETV